jgi:hypothetical protein
MPEEFYHTANVLAHLNPPYSLDRETYEHMNEVLEKCGANIRVGPATNGFGPEVGAGLSGLAGPCLGIYMKKSDKEKTALSLPSNFELSVEEALSQLDQKIAAQRK